MHFAHPIFFALFLVFPLVFYWNKRKTGQWVRWPALADAAPTAGTWRILLHRYLPILRYLSLAALIVALARPRHTFEETSTSGGIDIMLAIDLSPSMLSRDFSPDRLSIAKQVAANFALKRKADRIGLVTFAGEAYTVSPLTMDKQNLAAYIQELNVGRLEDGTAIGMGLATALNRLQNKNVKSRIVILMTDGENNAGYIPPLQAAEIAEREGVRVYTIGIGSNGVVLSPSARNFDGTYEFAHRYTRIDEALLTEIARMTNARYYRAFDETDLEDIYEEIDQLEKTEAEGSTVRYHE